MLHSAHIALSGLWLGCIVTGLLVGRNLRLAGEDLRWRRAQLSWQMAVVVEAPAFLGVLGTGASLLGQPHGVNLGVQVMVTAGLLSLFLGVFKVWLSYKQWAAAQAGRWATLEKLGIFHRMLGGLVLLGVVVAIVGGAMGRSAG